MSWIERDPTNWAWFVFIIAIGLGLGFDCSDMHKDPVLSGCGEGLGTNRDAESYLECVRIRTIQEIE